MKADTFAFLKQEFGIDEKVLKIVEEAENDIEQGFKETDDITVHNQYKVLKAFQKNRISDMHFGWNTGYGYDDAGRDAIERVYADIFGCEAALVRTQIVNGTHALSLTLSGILRPGDEAIYISGRPYDTLEDKESFTAYAKDGFGKEQQKRLSEVFKELSNKEVSVMLSNHNTDYIKALYKDFNIHVIEAKRMINSDPKGRGNVKEVIITNY